MNNPKAIFVTVVGSVPFLDLPSPEPNHEWRKHLRSSRIERLKQGDRNLPTQQAGNQAPIGETLSPQIHRVTLLLVGRPEKCHRNAEQNERKHAFQSFLVIGIFTAVFDFNRPIRSGGSVRSAFKYTRRRESFRLRRQRIPNDIRWFRRAASHK